MRAFARALAFTVLAASAHAGPATWLSVRAPDACEAAGEIAVRVNAKLVAEPSDRRARVTIESAAGRYRVTIEATRDSQTLGSKVLDASTCEEAADAAVVVLVLAFSAVGVGRTSVESRDDGVQVRHRARERWRER